MLLNYDGDQGATNVRRGDACASAPSPRPNGMQCDEYPFASTYQGGGPWGKTYSAQWQLIPAAENSLQGDVLGHFYSRMFDSRQGSNWAYYYGGSFAVVVQPPFLMA